MIKMLENDINITREHILQLRRKGNGSVAASLSRIVYALENFLLLDTLKVSRIIPKNTEDKYSDK